MNNLPKDPMLLLSVVNTKLRDFYDSLDAFCEDLGVNKEELIETLKGIDLSLIHIFRWIYLKDSLQYRMVWHIIHM